jgi:hypothetical protein
MISGRRRLAHGQRRGQDPLGAAQDRPLQTLLRTLAGKVPGLRSRFILGLLSVAEFLIEDHQNVDFQIADRNNVDMANLHNIFITLFWCCILWSTS